MRSTSIRPSNLRPASIRRLVGAGVGCLALGLSVAAMGTPAGAAETSPARHRPVLTAEQKQCLQDAGITRPVRPLTAEKIAAIKEAAKSCDIKLPKRHRGGNLTDEQKQCLQDAGITRPIRPLTAEKIAAIKEAAKSCDIKLPKRHRGGNLTDEQKQCLQDAGITRPVRPLTAEKIAAIKAAAQSCGIERPAGTPTEG